ncbi:hypothetical protein BDV25DRAFT_135409 [Aspergillus avenaceus]|uniref:Uncharacterized protein n=1 Tax=Aspergillus avenaceus TaxID=36643 RepID=A0A5N6U8X1_ASPAV|nr:hypothetical protein BDV25DRAFT_135409 [Aspergillus avenaceus]
MKTINSLTFLLFLLFFRWGIAVPPEDTTNPPLRELAPRPPKLLEPNDQLSNPGENPKGILSNIAAGERGHLGPAPGRPEKSPVAPILPQIDQWNNNRPPSIEANDNQMPPKGNDDLIQKRIENIPDGLCHRRKGQKDDYVYCGAGKLKYLKRYGYSLKSMIRKSCDNKWECKENGDRCSIDMVWLSVVKKWQPLRANCAIEADTRGIQQEGRRTQN